MECFSDLRGHEKPVHAIRQIVIRKDEVGAEMATRKQLPGLRPIGRRRRPMAFLRQHQLEEFAQFSVILNDQDRTGVTGIGAHPIISSERRLATE